MEDLIKKITSIITTDNIKVDDDFIAKLRPRLQFLHKTNLSNFNLVNALMMSESVGSATFNIVIATLSSVCLPEGVSSHNLNGDKLQVYVHKSEAICVYSEEIALTTIEKLQKIYYILQQREDLLESLNTELAGQEQDLLTYLGAIIKEANPFLAKSYNTFRIVYEVLNAYIKSQTNMSLSNLLREVKCAHMNTKAIDIIDTTAKESLRILLGEEIISAESESRFEAITNISSILRRYRNEIKSLLGASTRLKFRGSLVRGLKGYHKGGISPNMNCYDCDAFIEISPEMWEKIQQARVRVRVPKSKASKAVKLQKLRSYEDVEDIEVGITSIKAQRYLSETQCASIKEVGDIITRMQEIVSEIKSLIMEAKTNNMLIGYALKNNNTPAFEIYLRPISSVEKNYRDQNPYIRDMITARGYPNLAENLSVEYVGEYVRDAFFKYKHSILSTYSEDEIVNHSVKLPEFQIVIGAHEYYLEDERLFMWRNIINRHKITNSPINASRRKLDLYTNEGNYLYSGGYNTNLIEENNLQKPNGKPVKNHEDQERANAIFNTACDFPII